MKKLLIASLILAPLFVCSQQVAKNLTAANGQFIGFYQYTPTDYSANPNTQYPLIIFLHGIGERGDGVYNLPLVLANGVPKAINQGHNMRFYWNGKWETFLVLSPQLSNSYGDWPTFYVDEMIKYAKNNLRVDQNRIFLTGLSLGGGGVWRFASGSYTNASQLAGIAPVCGTCAMTNATPIVQANLPVWAFHAQNDGVVGVGCTTSAILSLNNANPAVKPLMTLYPDGGHGIWDRSYATDYSWHNINMYEWFLGQNKSLPANRLPIANAGPDQTINALLGSVNLSGAGSTDGDGNIARYIWKKISGPSIGSIVSSITENGLTAVTGLLTAGTYQFELTVVDNRGGTSTDVVTITASLLGGGNQAPVANAGPDQTTSATSVTLNGAGSSDADGSISSYRWAKTSGPSQGTISNTSAASTTVTGLAAGSYQFSLTVTDNAGASSTDYVQVTVNTTTPSNQAPVARAGNDISITLPANSVNVDGSGSSDPDGQINSWVWSKISGPAQYSINSPNGLTSSITGLAQGTYSFALAVTDNGGATSRDTINVVVNAAALPAPPPPNNQAPVANAGTNQTVTLPTNSTTLNGTGSSDADGSIASYSWSKVGGPDTYTTSGLTSASVNVTNMIAGLYTFRLIVTDNAGATSTAYVTVNVTTAPAGQPPVARAGNDISITLPTNNVTVDGSGSSDANGPITAFNWSQLSGPTTASITNANAASTSITNLSQGTYNFRLRVTDNSGVTATDDIAVVVSAAPTSGGTNIAPLANAGGNGTINLPTNSYTLNGASSSDPDGTIVSYAWNKIAGPDTYNAGNMNAVSATLSNMLAGTYTFRLVVVDNKGAMGIDYMSITVSGSGSPSNQLPVAIAGPSFSITLPTNSTTLNGSSSYDADGSIASYAWSKVSGPSQGSIVSPNSATTALTNLAQGTYQFRLTVRDNAGATGTSTVNVTVNPGATSSPGVAPISKAGPDLSITLPTNSVTLNGYNSYDPDGRITSWVWTKVSGPAGGTISNPTAGSTTVTGLVAGTYQFNFRVTDNSGLTGDDIVYVTVLGTSGSAATSTTVSAMEVQSAITEKVEAYPNPAISTINFRVSSNQTGPARVNVYDLSGRVVQSQQFAIGQTVQIVTMDVAKLTSGMYVAEVVMGTSKLTTKFTKQ